MRTMLRVLVSMALLLLVATQGDQEWLTMPGGLLIHHTCVHRHESAFHHAVHPDGHSVHLPSQGSTRIYPPCPYKPRRSSPTPVGYYSDWSVYAQSTAKTSYTQMSSNWTVPAAPASRGPAGLSSIYIFNGLEDGGGHHGNATLILQPVLQYGKSGCVLNPLLWGEWNLMAYLVDGSGRAHCGPRMRVSEGEEVFGGMQLTSGSTWEVTAARSKTGQVSRYTSTLAASTVIDAAYLTLEAMILYSCAAYPKGGGTTFTQNHLVEGGAVVSSVWTPEVRHSECGQGVAVDRSSGDVTLQYSTNSSA